MNLNRWEACTVELEQTGSPQGSGGGSPSGIDFGTLSIFGSSKKSKVILKLDFVSYFYFYFVTWCDNYVTDCM